MRKFIWFLLAIAVATYAIHGLVIGDLVNRRAAALAEWRHLCAA